MRLVPFNLHISRSNRISDRRVDGRRAELRSFSNAICQRAQGAQRASAYQQFRLLVCKAYDRRVSENDGARGAHLAMNACCRLNRGYAQEHSRK